MPIVNEHNVNELQREVTESTIDAREELLRVNFTQGILHRLPECSSFPGWPPPAYTYVLLE
jgi:hypothetical protein